MRRRAVLLLTVMTVALVMVASPAWAETFTVNSTGDEGDNSLGGTCATALVPEGIEPDCTLRAAIQEANNTTAADTINFGIPSSGVQTIEVGVTGNGALPPITQPLTIDGYTQRPCSEGFPAPCSRPNTKAVGTNAVLLVELDGSNVSGSNRLALELRASNNTIKGLVINRFAHGGIAILRIDANDNKIQGNFIGTDPSGTRDLGNGGSGVSLPSSRNIVGGDSNGNARNLISGNGTNGVTIYSGGSGNSVTGNLIGTKKDGTTALGNGAHGVLIYGSFDFVGSNTIAFNGGDGVQVDSGTGSSSNLVLSNSIHTNAELGIDLGPDGPTANDAGDADTGANNLQNYPTITSATTSRSTGRSVVRGTLNSTPGETFFIQLFTNPAPDPSGFGEGRRLLRTLNVTTDASGNASFSMKARKLKGVMSATATTNKAAFGTSEFSKAKKVVRKR